MHTNKKNKIKKKIFKHMRNGLTSSFGAQVERGDLIGKQEEKEIAKDIVINFYIVGIIGFIR